MPLYWSFKFRQLITRPTRIKIEIMVNNSRGREILILVNIHIREEMLVNTYKSIQLQQKEGEQHIDRTCRECFGVACNTLTLCQSELIYLRWSSVVHSHNTLLLFSVNSELQTPDVLVEQSSKASRNCNDIRSIFMSTPILSPDKRRGIQNSLHTTEF